MWIVILANSMNSVALHFNIDCITTVIREKRMSIITEEHWAPVWIPALPLPAVCYWQFTHPLSASVSFVKFGRSGCG